jgi:hypothetical protein
MRRDFNWHIESKTNSRFGNYMPPGNVVLEPTATLTFVLTYPLTKPFTFSETHPDGSPWTEMQFAEALHRAYVEIYAAEEVEDPNPGNVPGMWNRAQIRWALRHLGPRLWRSLA